jgi:hypothetical protein
MDVPPENSHRRHAPEGRAARGVLSLPTFFARAKQRFSTAEWLVK